MTALKKNLTVFDLDSTLTLKDTYLDFLIRFLLTHPARLVRTIGLPFDVANFKLGRRNNCWLKQRFLNAILGGIHRDELDRASDHFVADLMARGMREEALERLSEHQKAGDRVILVTASFDFYVRLIAEQLAVDECLATSAEWKDDLISGKLAGQNCYGAEKLRRLDMVLGDTRDEYFVTAYSDHHSDLDLLQWADKAIAVAPTRRLADVAKQKNWEILGQ